MIESVGSPITGSLVTKLTPMLRRMAQRRVRQEDIDDVVQETWSSALRSVSHYQGRSKLSVWIVQILKRRIADSYRRERRDDVLLEDMGACDGALAVENAEYAQFVRSIEGALVELTELERAAVRLCDLREVGHAEAARALGITPNHLRVTLHRARSKLASVLRDHESARSRLLTRAVCRPHGQLVDGRVHQSPSP